MALTDKVERLQATVIVLEERAAVQTTIRAELKVAIAALDQRVTALEKALALLELKSALELATLSSWKADQKKREEEWGRRTWSFGPNIVAAVLTIVLSAFVAWLMSRRP